MYRRLSNSRTIGRPLGPQSEKPRFFPFLVAPATSLIFQFTVLVFAMRFALFTFSLSNIRRRNISRYHCRRCFDCWSPYFLSPRQTLSTRKICLFLCMISWPNTLRAARPARFCCVSFRLTSAKTLERMISYLFSVSIFYVLSLFYLLTYIVNITTIYIKVCDQNKAICELRRVKTFY